MSAMHTNGAAKGIPPVPSLAAGLAGREDGAKVNGSRARARTSSTGSGASARSRSGSRSGAAPGSGGRPPLSTPRRRLAAALAMEHAVSSDGKGDEADVSPVGFGAGAGSGGGFPAGAGAGAGAAARMNTPRVASMAAGPMTPRTAPCGGERLMHRAGKKIDGNYALVTMLGEMNKIRIVVYLVETCQRFSLACTLAPGTDASSVPIVRMLLDGLHLDKSGGVTLSGDIPATWVAL